MTEWEYTRVFAEGSRTQYDGGRGPMEAKSEAIENWFALLNQCGADGWELIVERYQAGGDSGSGYWATYAGTMKRPRGPAVSS